MLVLVLTAVYAPLSTIRWWVKETIRPVRDFLSLGSVLSHCWLSDRKDIIETSATHAHRFSTGRTGVRNPEETTGLTPVHAENDRQIVGDELSK